MFCKRVFSGASQRTRFRQNLTSALPQQGNGKIRARSLVLARHVARIASGEFLEKTSAALRRTWAAKG
jgi:hypothetical protein